MTERQVIQAATTRLFGRLQRGGETGWAAIHGSRGPLATAQDVHRRVQLDVDYIERQSFWLDLWIMVATVPVLLGDRLAVR